MRQNIEDLIEGIFDENEQLEELYFTPTNLVSAMELRKTDTKYIRKVLKKEMKMEPVGVIKYLPGNYLNGTKQTGRPYCFKRNKNMLL